MNRFDELTDELAGDARSFSDGTIVGEERDARPPVILSFVLDWPNLVTLLGLCCGILAIYFALSKNFPAAIIALLWAVLFDWYDGLVARMLPGRKESYKLVGAHMDSLVDLVTSATVPAILLLSIGDFSAWFYPGALAIVMAGVLRLAYFDAFGVGSDGTCAGLTIDHTPLVLGSVFLLNSFLDPGVFAGVLYASLLVMAFLHVAPFRIRKLGGVWYPVVTVYVAVLTVVYSYMLLSG